MKHFQYLKIIETSLLTQNHSKICKNNEASDQIIRYPYVPLFKIKYKMLIYFQWL